jgi:hypothetical protein
MVHVVGNSTGDSILSSNGVLGQAKADERRGKTYCETLGEVDLIYPENVYSSISQWVEKKVALDVPSQIGPFQVFSHTMCL